MESVTLEMKIKQTPIGSKVKYVISSSPIGFSDEFKELVWDDYHIDLDNLDIKQK